MSEPRIISLDSQILDAIQKCSFFTFLMFVKNYRLDETKDALERGSLGHHLLELYYQLIKRNEPFESILEFCAKEGREYYQKLNIEAEESEMVINTFYQYAHHYRYDQMVVNKVEESFSLILEKTDDLIVVYQGKIDLDCNLPIIGNTVIDHKWRKMKADYSPLDNQFMGYALYKNINVMYVNEVGMQKSYEPAKKFRRVPISFTDGLKERWRKNTIQWARYLDFNLQTNNWPQSHLKTLPTGTTQCVKCEMNRICYSDNEEEMAEKIKRHFYITNEWDVGAKLEIELE